MTSNYVQLPPNSTGLKVDTNELTVGGNTVERQNTTLADPTTAAALAAVLNADPTDTTYAVVTRNLTRQDTNRNPTNWFMVLPILTTATDTLMSLTGYKSGAAVTATTTPAVVTTGKTYRVNAITLAYVAVATAGTARFTLRANTGGVVAIGSPAVTTHFVGGAAATAGVAETAYITFPDGMEFAAGTGIGVSLQGYGATQTAAAVGYGQATIQGFEY